MIEVDGDKHVGVVGMGRSVGTLASTLAEIKRVCTVHDLEIAEIVFPEVRAVELLKEERNFCMQPMISDYNCPEEIKKRIKHCKNTMEKRNLQRELNEAYINKKIYDRRFKYSGGNDYA